MPVGRRDLLNSVLRLLLLGFAAAAATAAWSQTGASDEKLKLLMQGVGARAASAPPSADRLRERNALLQQGEALLAARNASQAEQAFDRAAMILHAADTEMGLVRSYMQAGQYRRALAFGAHTAGAHLDVVGGAALYAWLLHLGGQEAHAARLMAEAHARAPQQPLVGNVLAQLRSRAPRAHGAMLISPARLAPSGSVQGLPRNARTTSTGTLVGEGRYALVPEEAVSKGARSWVRNGLGDLAAAEVHGSVRAHGLVLLKLASPLRDPVVVSAATDAFPGSVAFAAQYVAAADAQPAWPLLRAGFTGAAVGDTAGREVGVEMVPGSPHGGPVFDQAGRLSGIAVRAKQGDRLVAASQLRSAFGTRLGIAAGGSADKRSADSIYESALLVTLQVIRSP